MGEMTTERAAKIVGDCVLNRMYSMGVTEEEPPSLADYSLRELLDANEMIRKENAEGTTLRVSCDDRLVAALYAVHHYPGEDPNSVEPIVTHGDSALVCVATRNREEGDNV